MTASRSSTIGAGKLQAFAQALLASAGLGEPGATVVAESLVWADLRGSPGHGVARIPQYAAWLASGEINGRAQPRPGLSLPALTVIEGDRCAGALGMQLAARHAIAGARKAGASLVLLRETTHTGALGFHTAHVAREGMFAMAMAASGPLMAYHGASVAGVSTAPLSMACPGPCEPIVFDMASGAVAFGKLMQARATGRPLEPGWAIDAMGNPTTDARLATTPLPLGGPKGSGLALMAEIACSLLGNHPILAPALLAPAAMQRHTQNAWMLVIDIAQVLDPSRFQEHLAELAAAIHDLPASAEGPPRLPGERGYAEACVRNASGIALAPATADALEALGRQAGIGAPWA
ncbi:putative oxidoreductase YjmC [Cupriavidus yeoncheonensis]|uniref:Oxidoreductase YjmC n=1 Tax=Cupriavidus yeoncheonensis TaxID=1462994 RepID=A0A916IPE2_9BURK|nr:Ldh family oxidoreductase [Cupriavidus yeoncheonensis]CAG2127140.1 putative oxidoreductase YjmC [Cupriavidus yeoncheonensis]